MKFFFYISFLALFSILFTPYANAQNSIIDSLLVALKTAKEDTTKVKIYDALFSQYQYVDAGKAEVFASKELALAQKINYKKGIGIAYMHLGFAADDKGDYPLALKNHFISLKIRQENGNKKGTADSYSCIGIVYDNQGNYPEALKMYFTALKMYEAIGEKDDIADVYNNIGLIYDEQGNYTEALKNHLISLKYEKARSNNEGIANSYINIGAIHEKQNENSEALKFYIAALKIMREIGNKQGISHAYNNIGVIYYNLRNYPEALKNHFAALKLKEELGDKSGIASSYCNIGYTLTKQKENKKAEEYLNRAKELSKIIGSKENLKFAYNYLTNLYSEKGDFKAAFEHHKLFIIYKDSLNNEETKKKTIQNAMTYEFEKKEIEAKAGQEKLNAISFEEKQKQQIIIYAVIGVLLVVLIFSLFLFNRFRLTQRQKNIIELQKIRVDKAYENLHEKNKEVMDSIYYARRIQRALITSEKYIERNLIRLIKSS